MQNTRRIFLLLLIKLSTSVAAQAQTEYVERHSVERSKVTATTECRAGCRGNTAGCQESYETALLAASPGMRLYANTVTVSRSWPGEDTSGLVREPVWDKEFNPPGDPRPLSVTVKPKVETCEGRSGDRQSRTHYEITAVQGPQ